MLNVQRLPWACLLVFTQHHPVFSRISKDAHVFNRFSSTSEILDNQAHGSANGSIGKVAWTEGTGWEKGGSLAWETLDAKGEQTGSGRADGVPVWGFAAAVAEPDGSFTLFY